jgi:hypothetical protein
MSDNHGGALELRHETTRDCPDGAPWPPDGDGWVMVRRANGGTLWRLIQLVLSDPPPTDAYSNFGGCTERQQTWQRELNDSPRNASTRKS